MTVPRVAILGAGSVGCFIGGAWAAAGVPVSFIGRDTIGKGIAADGLTLTDFTGWRVRLPPDQVDFSTPLGAPVFVQLARRFLNDAVTDVLYPDTDEVARRQMRRFGGMVSFRVSGGEEHAVDVCGRTRVFTVAESEPAVLYLHRRARRSG